MLDTVFHPDGNISTCYLVGARQGLEQDGVVLCNLGMVGLLAPGVVLCRQAGGTVAYCSAPAGSYQPGCLHKCRLLPSFLPQCCCQCAAVCTATVQAALRPLVNRSLEGVEHCGWASMWMVRVSCLRSISGRCVSRAHQQGKVGS